MFLDLNGLNLVMKCKVVILRTQDLMYNANFRTNACTWQLISFYYSMFQTLGQWGQLKKQEQDERGLVKKIGGHGRERPSLFLYQTSLIACWPAAFNKPH